jgi:hypothetical protein
MAIRHRKGLITQNRKKYQGDREIKPTLYVKQNGKKLMVGSVDGELIYDINGEAIPYKSLPFHMNRGGSESGNPDKE